MVNVLDLFSGTQSVRKALTKMYNITSWKTWSDMGYAEKNGYKIPYLVYGFNNFSKQAVVTYVGLDIYSPEEQNTIFDLTMDNVLSELKMFLGEWKPDFIWCSPPCNYFSRAITGSGGNFYFEVDDKKNTSY